jgi:hypothetical protein
MVKELIAKLKFWFGDEYVEDLFNTQKYIYEYNGDYVYIYKEVV